MKNLISSLFFVFIFVISCPSSIHSQIDYDEKLYEFNEWREIGPFRGGRSAAVTGVPGNDNLFYFGATGGGVWKTSDAGKTWENISDGFFGGSIGAIAVSESDPNIIYVGGGEVTVRGNMSHGYGIWKSEDSGESWKEMGLSESMHIPRIKIHPKNPDIVFAAVLGNVYGSSNERGVYKSVDGGSSWRKVLFTSEQSGAVDLCLDPNNPRIIYASTWKIRRTPYSLESGGEGSALWKSTDSGETWTNISSNKGLPSGTWGISGITVSPANSNRIWAIIENKDGGVFRSDDKGTTWTKVNDNRSLRQRAWYYTRIYADSKDQNLVYVLNVSFHKSTDGGKSFKSIRTPHGDHHDLWIAPDNPKRMVIGDDGGAQVTFDGGNNWTPYNNQPTAQFYRVTTDNSFPYRIYAAQQDNSTVRIKHRTDGSSITENDWESTAGCECGHIAIDPTNNDIVYGGCYDGYIERRNHKTGQSRSINVWPDNPMGHGAEGMKYRFQWNFPIFFSPHDPKKLYTASNHLHVSTNEGQSWEIISPDLTRNDSSKLVSSGGPITKDNTSVEYYCTIFAAAESFRVKDLLWVGSDDGLVHITKDGGANWENVTPRGLPKWAMINSIEPDPHHDGGCYFAATLYKEGDFKPYIFSTKDYGKTWKKIVNGIKDDHFTRVVRADPEKSGYLYAGTETGMYISFDDGNNWKNFQLNLPVVPITDLTIKNNNLIAATQGRSLWIIDDLTILHQLDHIDTKKSLHLFTPLSSYRMGGRQVKDSKTSGTNLPGGVSIKYFLKNEVSKKDTIEISIFDSKNELIRSYSTHHEMESDKFEAKQGGNSFNWDLRYEDAQKFDGLIMWGGSLAGPRAIPGEYKVVIAGAEEKQETKFTLLKDPRSEVSHEDIQTQFEFVKGVRDKLDETHQIIKDIRSIRSQIKHFENNLEEEVKFKEVIDLGNTIDSMITKVEKELYQTQNRSNQDPLNFPIKLNNKLAALNSLVNRGDFPPTQQSYDVRDDLINKINIQIDEFKSIVDDSVAKYNELIKIKSVPAIYLKNK